mmetsp:Transcript_132444/g.411743  ORF Transcript_132444/g.411743 Transcript_132444/m.411743 type:complete len:252 (-) Transcript_132444:420-1175(-)
MVAVVVACLWGSPPASYSSGHDECMGAGAHYMIDESEPTGTCTRFFVDIVCSLGKGMCAANDYKVERCQRHVNWKLVRVSKLIYSKGFLVMVARESIRLVCVVKLTDGGISCVDLAALFLVQIPLCKSFFLAGVPLARDVKIDHGVACFVAVSRETITLTYTETLKDGGIYYMVVSAPFLVQLPPVMASFAVGMRRVRGREDRLQRRLLRDGVARVHQARLHGEAEGQRFRLHLVDGAFPLAGAACEALLR